MEFDRRPTFRRLQQVSPGFATSHSEAHSCRRKPNDSAEPLTPFPDSEGPLGAYTITPVDYILPLFGAGKITPIADNTEFGLGQSGSSILPSLLEGQYSSAAVVPHLQDVAIGVLEVGRSFSQSLGSESSRAALPGLLTVLDESSRERRILGLVHGQAHVIH